MPCNPSPNSSPQERVTFLDGGPALLHMTSKLLPRSNMQRCFFHLDRDLVKKREPATTRATYRHRPPLFLVKRRGIRGGVRRFFLFLRFIC